MRRGDRLRGHEETIGERLVRDLAVFHSLPPAPYDACEKRTGRVSSLSLVRYRGTDYSVPTAYAHREVLIRGYVTEVVISCGAKTIARHPRSYEREDFVFDPLHYLALLEQKIGALDQAAPLVGWDLPEEFATLRRLIEARMGKSGCTGITVPMDKLDDAVVEHLERRLLQPDRLCMLMGNVLDRRQDWVERRRSHVARSAKR